MPADGWLTGCVDAIMPWTSSCGWRLSRATLGALFDNRWQHSQEGVVMQYVVVEQRRCGMDAYQEITHRAATFM